MAVFRREGMKDGKGRGTRGRGGGPRREAFIKRERTNVAIKTKPTAFVQRWFLPWSSIPTGPRRSSHPRSSGVVYAARNRGGEEGSDGKNWQSFFFFFSFFLFFGDNDDYTERRGG